jgi:hypothetical protein
VKSVALLFAKIYSLSAPDGENTVEKMIVEISKNFRFKVEIREKVPRTEADYAAKKQKQIAQILSKKSSFFSHPLPSDEEYTNNVQSSPLQTDLLITYSQLRIKQYRFPDLDRDQIYRVIHKIPNVNICAASVVAGLTAIELLKIVSLERQLTLENIRNRFVNLAEGFSASSAPLPVKYVTTPSPAQYRVCDWDRLDVRIGGDPTVAEVIEFLERVTGLKVTSLMTSYRLIYCGYLGHLRDKARR